MLTIWRQRWARAAKETSCAHGGNKTPKYEQTVEVRGLETANRIKSRRARRKRIDQMASWPTFTDDGGIEMEPKFIATKNEPLQINVTTHAINGSNGSVGLTPREYGLLSCLVDHAGHPMSRADLLRDAWGWDYATELKTKTVDMHVRRLRVKFERAGLDPNSISTVRGRGYAYIA